jgi:hypothetical protein
VRSARNRPACEQPTWDASASSQMRRESFGSNECSSRKGRTIVRQGNRACGHLERRYAGGCNLAKDAAREALILV